jgi:hypothetical protein
MPMLVYCTVSQLTYLNVIPAESAVHAIDGIQQ